LVAKAKQEGAVTVYSVQDPTTLAAMAAAFKAQYGISVTINRAVDSVLLTQVEAEEQTGKAVADIWVPSGVGEVLNALNAGWAVAPVGPDFYNPKFNRTVYMPFGAKATKAAWIDGEAVLSPAWNTNLAPGGVTDIPSFLGAAFKGKMGLPTPLVSTSFMDWYLWLDQTYGKGKGLFNGDFLSKLAAQGPFQIYPSSLTIAQQIAAGTLAGSPIAANGAITALQAQGAPVKLVLANKGNNWNAPYYGMVLKQAPHPAAAQLLADFMISQAGSALVDKGYGADYNGIPGTYYSKPRIMNPFQFTPGKVTAFNNAWVAHFTH